MAKICNIFRDSTQFVLNYNACCFHEIFYYRLKYRNLHSFESKFLDFPHCEEKCMCSWSIYIKVKYIEVLNKKHRIDEKIEIGMQD